MIVPGDVDFAREAKRADGGAHLNREAARILLEPLHELLVHLERKVAVIIRDRRRREVASLSSATRRCCSCSRSERQAADWK